MVVREAELIGSKSAASARGAPSVRILVPVEQRFQLLLALPLADLLRIAFFEVFGSYLEEPFGVDGAHLPHILFSGLDKLMVDDPLGSFVEQRRTWVDKHLLVIADGFVALCGVLAAAVVEEASADRLSNLSVVLQLQASARDHWEAEALHYLHQLLPHILAAFHRTSLDEVFIAPLVLEAVHFPCLVYGEHGQMVTVFVIELGPLLVGKLLLLAWAIEHVLDREH